MRTWRGAQELWAWGWRSWLHSRSQFCHPWLMAISVFMGMKGMTSPPRDSGEAVKVPPSGTSSLADLGTGPSFASLFRAASHLRWHWFDVIRVGTTWETPLPSHACTAMQARTLSGPRFRTGFQDSCMPFGHVDKGKHPACFSWQRETGTVSPVAVGNTQHITELKMTPMSQVEGKVKPPVSCHTGVIRKEKGN